MRIRTTILIGTVAALLLVSVWYRMNHDKRAVQAVTDQFWVAATAGDESKVAALLAPGAPVPAKVWLEQNAGMTYSAAPAPTVKSLGNSCGLEMGALTIVRDRSHMPHGRTLWLKRVDGRWLVYSGDGKLCP